MSQVQVKITVKHAKFRQNNVFVNKLVSERLD